MALQTSPSPSSSSRSFSSSSISYAWKYHVFLSFRGPDTRHGFIGHLHKALSDKGIRTFFDDEELQRGEEITPSLAKAIEESRIAIPVFSKSYASSKFCLDELVKIMECVKGKGRLVLPIFYDVEPCDVRHQSGGYGEALARLEERFKDDKERVQKWREALRQAANLSGEHFNLGNEYECDFIVKIVKEISKRISRVPLHVADYPVGLESRVIEVNQLLNDGSECRVHMVGIYGIGGISKTTLAKAIYNSIADQFESLCFFENMIELSDRHGLVYLLEMVLSKILGDKVCNLGSVSEGTSIIKERLPYKKVLLVLDNVDERGQLQEIIGSLSELGTGSKVIITTRDKHSLTIHGVKKAYEVKVLNEEEAVELFSWKAFKFEKVEPCYMDILKKLVRYASGLLLALEVIGSSLSGRSVEKWRSALDEYQKIPNGDVQKKLKVISFDVLNPQEKEIFLDIACCFKEYEYAEVVDILHAHYEVDPKYWIDVLVDKSLIKINKGLNNACYNVITLHDLIQDMGREIVRSEELWAHSRLWLAKDIIEVLQGDKTDGSGKIQLINLECDYNDDVIEWDGQAFRRMDNLRTLIIRKCKFSQGPTYLPSSLRVLIWELCSSEEFLPFYFNPKHLAMLKLSGNCFDSVQLTDLLKKKFEKMRILKFDYCNSIKKIPNLSSAPKLEVLSFAGCYNLTEIDESVGSLGELKTLNASQCSQLRSLPPLMLPSLEQLELDHCKSLESFPEILGKMEKMTQLYLSDVGIKKFPYSIHNLTGLRSLSMWWDGEVELPSIITLLEVVETLSFNYCKGLLLPNEDEGEEQVSSMSFSNKPKLDIHDCKISEEIFRTALPMFSRLESLHLREENFRIVPECIGEFQFLRSLKLITCERLEEIRGIPPNIEELLVVNCTSLSALTREMLLNKKVHEEGQDKMFILPEPGERLPEWFEYRRRELSIAFWFRNKFPAISFGLFTRTDPLDQSTIRPRLTINGAKSFQLVAHDYESYDKQEVGHILIFSKTQTTFRDQVGEALSEDEWKRAVFAVYDDEPFDRNKLDCVEVGIHIIEEKSCMDDIRFPDPLSQDPPRDVGYSDRFVQQQTYSDRFKEYQRDVGILHSKSKKMSSTTTTLNVQALPSTSSSIRLESRVSFDALEEVHQQIFLDIVCCFKGYRLKAVEEMLHAHYGVNVKHCINILVEKCLIEIGKHDDDDYVILHDLIQDMGREIIRLESPNKPEARSRLWLAEEIIEVLQDDKGSSKIQVINLEFDDNGDVIEWDGLAFKKMENLRTLIIEKRQFSQFPKYLPSNLRVLEWEIHPLQEILPFDFHPKQLVKFDLSRNCFDSVQVAELLKKEFENLKVLKFDYCKHITKIPNLSSAPKLELLSFVRCKRLTEIDESVGFLDKLETLDALGCGKLRSLPPLMLPSLKDINLKFCSDLESFPEILGKMECMTRLDLSFCHDIKKLPYSIHNLTRLQSLYLERCGVVELPSGIMLPRVETLSFDDCLGLLLPIQDEGEEQVSLMPFSNTTHLYIYSCYISEEFLRIVLPLFPRLQSLCLREEDFRILPECIREFQFLRLLDLSGCEKLEEIRAIPPNIEELHACNCRSLSSLTTEMLLSKKLYEEGQDKSFILHGERLPVWFEHQRRESSITFWFRNKFPAISFGVLNPNTAFRCFIRAKLTINGTKPFRLVQYGPNVEEGLDGGIFKMPYMEEGLDGHLIFIFSKTQTTFRDQVDEALSENEWNRAVFSVYYHVHGLTKHKQKDLGSTVEVGVHIIEERSSMDDIRFTDPLPSTFNDNVNGNSNSKRMSSTATTLNVQGFQEEQNLTSIDQHKLEGCESVDKACNNNAREDKDKNPSAELLSITKNHGKDSDEEVLETTIVPSSISEASRSSYESSSSFDKTPAKIQKTVTIQGVLTISSKNYDKDSEVEVVETTTVPTAISKAKSGSCQPFIHSENVDQPVNSSIEIQPPSPQPLDPLAELERLLLGSYDGSLESTSPTAASCSEIQRSEVCIILQNLKPSLDNPLEILIAEGEIKLQIMDCLSKLVQLEDHIPISLQSIVAHVRDFYDDLIHSFPSIQQTLVDYSCLEETRSKFLENLKEAKVKQAQIDAEFSREMNQLEEMAAEIADLETKLKEVVEKRNELQLAIKNDEAEKNKILEDASAWLLESKQVVKKMKSSEHAHRDAQNSKARLEERLAKLKGAFAEVRYCPSESSIHFENVDQPMHSLIEIQPPSPQPLDPLAELERLLLGSYDLTSESSSPTAASSADIQASEVVIILQNLEPLLDNQLGSLIADGEIKHQILDCLSKLGQLEDHIPIPLQSVVAQVRDFYEDLIQNFPSIQQTLVDYSCLEETRSKFLENLKQAKVKQAQIDAEVSQEKVQVEGLDAEIADLELKLKAAVENRNKLQLAIKNGEAEKNKILEYASAWLLESKQVVKKMKSSEHAYRDAQNTKTRLERRLAKLKEAFATNKP